jgi:hypothetical protein
MRHEMRHEMRHGMFHINMKHMNKWKAYTDNINFLETIHHTKGVFFCSGNADAFRYWLDEFCIFYTFKGVK